MHFSVLLDPLTFYKKTEEQKERKKRKLSPVLYKNVKKEGIISLLRGTRNFADFEFCFSQVLAPAKEAAHRNKFGPEISMNRRLDAIGEE